MSTLEHFDEAHDEHMLMQLQRKMEKDMIMGMAEQAALKAHPVVDYVKHLPVESTLYPAIEYLRLASKTGHPISDIFDQVHEGKTCFRDTSGNIVFYRPEYHRFIDWELPAHDLERPKRCGCGFIRGSSGGIVYSMCPDHPEHFCKGKRNHCWDLGCPDCMNDTALDHGVEVEKQLMRYRRLLEKQNLPCSDVGHWVVSPPQEMAKSLMQSYDEFDELYSYVCGSLQKYGAHAGVTIFHPWRQQQKGWVASPHFHSLVYGRINTKQFLRDNPGWIIKKVHPKQKIRSIRHTAAYLFTHMGLGLYERDPDDIDWDLDIIDYLIPGIKSDKGKYTEKDYELLSIGKGRMVGDLSQIDWEEWTMQRLTGKMKIRYWGGVARNKIRTVGFDRQYKIRVCKECGEILRVYDGPDDSIGSYVRYIQDNYVFCFAHQLSLVNSTYLKYKAKLKSADLTLSDFASMVPFAVSTLEFMPQNKDLVMKDPFEEPDEYFLRRQKEDDFETYSQ